MKALKMFCLLAICVLAIGAGAQQNPPAQGSGENQAGRGRMPSPEDQLKNLTEKLSLTTDQQAKVKTILENTNSEMTKVRQDDSMSREDKMAKGRSLREASNGKIRELLNDDQKKKFDDMQKEAQERMRQRQQGGDSNPK